MARRRAGSCRTSIQRRTDRAMAPGSIDATCSSARQGAARTVAASARTIRLRGEHNVANVVMAAAIGARRGLRRRGDGRGPRAAFAGVPHRLEIVGSAGGATWVNDSIATSPERTMAGPAGVQGAGRAPARRPRQEPRRSTASRSSRTSAAAPSSASARPAPLFHERMQRARGETAASWQRSTRPWLAAASSQAGDVVLLSPAGTSFDAYPSFEARGEAFRALVRALPGLPRRCRHSRRATAADRAGRGPSGLRADLLAAVLTITGLRRRLQRELRHRRWRSSATPTTSSSAR